MKSETRSDILNAVGRALAAVSIPIEHGRSGHPTSAARQRPLLWGRSNGPIRFGRRDHCTRVPPYLLRCHSYWLRRWISVLCLSALLLVELQAEAGPRTPTHVACVGDSITAGVGASSSHTNYPARLQKLLGSGAQVSNFGHSGATMLSAGFGDAPYQHDSEYTAATDFVSKAGTAAVVDVIIMLGANDSSSRNWTPPGKPKNDQQFLKDYRAMVEHFSALPSKPVVYLVLPLSTGANCSCGTLCCQISGSVIYDEQLPLIRQLAAEKGVPTIDLNAPTKGHPEYFSDGIHPNDNGYVVVAQTMLEGLQRIPTVTFTSPLAGSRLNAALPVVLTAAAAGGTVAIERVEFFQGATSLGLATTAPFTLSWMANVGSYLLSAKATDTTQATATSDPTKIEITMHADLGGAGGSAGADIGGAGGVAMGGLAGQPAGGNSGNDPSSGGAPSVSVAGAAPAAPVLAPAPGCSCNVADRTGNFWTSAVLFSLSLLARRRHTKRV